MREDGAAVFNAVHAEAAGMLASEPAVGRMLGPWRIDRELGRGGMSVVYLGSRADGEFSKQVALKLIKRGMDTDAVIARVRRERGILAALDHPGISRLLDGGTSEDGLPWIAMEYVDGVPIDCYCNDHSLNIDRRCELIVEVCEAAAFAHRNLIVHGDIKPGNILVDLNGKPRLLDFGIARLLHADADSLGPLTRGLYRPLTPEYASPEQLAGAPLGTATDVYSLGVVLYELLTGNRPRTGAEPASSAALHNGRGNRVAARLRGDLDNILQMALRPEPERRYLSVSQFALDIRRHLDRLPIAARSDTIRYRAGKFLRRNRLGVAAAAAIVLALTGGVAVSTWEARRARLAEQIALRESDRAKADRDRALAAEQAATQSRNTAEAERSHAQAERERANTQAASATAVSDFLRNDLLGQANPEIQQTGPDLKVRTALDRAAQRIEGKFSRQPLVEADIRKTIGESYHALGVFPDAERQHQRVVDLRLAVLGEKNRDTLEALHSLAVDYHREGKYEQSERTFNRMIGVAGSALGERDPLTLRAMADLAVVYGSQQKFAQEIALDKKTLQAQKVLLGPEHVDTLDTMNSLAADYFMLGQFDEAARLYEPLLPLSRRVLGGAHPHTLVTANNLAVVYLSPGGNPEAAERILLETLDAQRRLLGADHPSVATTLGNLGLLREHQKRYAEAETLFTDCARVRERALGARHPWALKTWADAGLMQVLQGKTAEAEQTLRRAYNGFNEAGLDKWQRYTCASSLGRTLALERRFAEAEPLLVSGYEGLRKREAAMTAFSKPDIQRAAQWLSELYIDEGKPDLAAAIPSAVPLEK